MPSTSYLSYACLRLSVIAAPLSPATLLYQSHCPCKATLSSLPLPSLQSHCSPNNSQVEYPPVSCSCIYMCKLLHSCFVSSLLHPSGHLFFFLPAEVPAYNHLSHFSPQTQLPSLFSPCSCTISVTPSSLSLSCLPFLLSFPPVSRPHYNRDNF